MIQPNWSHCLKDSKCYYILGNVNTYTSDVVRWTNSLTWKTLYYVVTTEKSLVIAEIKGLEQCGIAASKDNQRVFGNNIRIPLNEINELKFKDGSQTKGHEAAL